MTDYGPSRGFQLRYLIGAGIALVAFIGYFTRTSVNPTTGVKEHVGLTAQQETALGLQAAPEMAAQMGGEVPASDPQTQEVRKVGEKVWHDSEASRGPYPYQYHLLGDTSTVNAFALPGGQVFITKALLDRLKTEGELAGVLGHETGHVVQRHVAKQMEQKQLGGMLAMAAGVATSDDRNGNSHYAIAQMVDQMAQLHFSRGDESEADTKGLAYMTQAGYDPRAMLDVMKVLLEVTQKQGRPPQMLVTHPYPEQRMEDITAYLKAHYPNGVPSGLQDPPLPWVGRGIPKRVEEQDKW